MASEKKTCRVCGKEYGPCRTANRDPNVFHWQEVACSPACGAEYLRRVMEARTPVPPVPKSSKGRRRAAPVVEAAGSPAAESVSEPEDQAPAEASAGTPVEDE